MTGPLTARLGLPTDRGPRILVASAHADDAEIGAGGTVMRLVAERPDGEVAWVVLASPDPDRAAEARDSAGRLLGPARRSEIEIGGLRDGYLPYLGPAAKEALVTHQPFDPDLILCPRKDDAHQDHRHLAELVPQVFRRGVVLEYEIPKWDGDLGQANLYVPLSTAEANAKTTHVLAAFRTQHGRTWFTEDTLHATLRLRGIECRAPDGLAEAFICRKLVV